jgi:hypothetical protein
MSSKPDFLRHPAYDISQRGGSVQVTADHQVIFEQPLPEKRQILALKLQKMYEMEQEVDEPHFKIAESLSLHANEEQLQQLEETTGGRSGEFFFFTADNRLVIKSVSHNEMETLEKIIPKYDNYIKSTRSSLLVRILGIFELTIKDPSHKVFLLIMKSTNCGIPKDCIESTWDLKGSTASRNNYTDEDLTTIREEKRRKGSMRLAKTGKDNDFLEVERAVQVGPDQASSILQALKTDSEFLLRLGLIDYSCLVTKVHIKQLPGRVLQENLIYPSNADETWGYTLGIIDLLQEYDYKKRLEKTFKVVASFNLHVDTSVQPPANYQRRFLEFFGKVII